jgi:hypothetical protein
MKTLLLLSALTLGLTHAAAIAQPAPKPLSRAQLMTACLSEAEWPVTASPAYVNASAHHKAQMTNAYNADVRALKAMCVRMNGAQAADLSALGSECQSLIETTTRRYGPRGEAHLSRGSAICKAMAAPSI